MDLVFPIAGVVLLVTTTAWIVLHVRANGTRWAGIAGAVLSALVVSAIGFLSDVAWLWTMPTLWFASWVLGIVLLGVEFAKLPYGLPAGGKPAAACAFVTLAASAIAFLVTMWLATVSPGGV